MTTHQIVVFAIMGLTLVLLVWGRWRFDLVAFAALVVAVVVGAVPYGEAFAGFGHPAVIIIALVLVISRALTQAGVVEFVSRGVIKVGRPLALHIAAISGLGAALSAFMNNVAALAMLMPVDLQAAAKAKRSPALTLMPLSFATILGGMVTLIGTPPNIVIAQFRERELGTPYQMFDFTPVGLACAVAGCAVIALIGWRLIPAAAVKRNPAEELENIDDYIIEVGVPEESPAIGKTVRELRPAADETGVTILGLVHRGKRLPGMAAGETVRKGDVLVIEAAAEQAEQFAGELKLTYSKSAKHKGALAGTLTLIEVVVPSGARIEGRSADDVQLLSRHGVQLLGVSRQGRRFRHRVRQLPVQAGDILLLMGSEEQLPATANWLGCLPLGGRGLQVVQRDKLWLGLGVFAAAIGAAAAGLMPLTAALAACVVVYVVLKVITLSQVYEAIDWPVIVLLASLIPLGQALEEAGGTGLIATGIVGLTEGWPAVAVLTLLMIVTMALSDVLNNVATALIMAPVAIDIAARLGVSFDFMLMGVAVAASCAFLTPIGHKNNTIIMGPGGYRFGDYWRLGLVIEAVVLVVAIPAISLVWQA